MTATTTPTAVAAVIIVERTGIGRDLEPGSSANRVPVVAAIEAPLDASHALTRDGCGSSAAANTRDVLHAGHTATAQVRIHTPTPPRSSTHQSPSKPGEISASRAGPIGAIGDNR